MKIYKTKASGYTKVNPDAIAYDIQVMAAYIAEKVNSPEGAKRFAMREQLSKCDKTQLKAIAAELDTVQKRLEWILDGRY